MAPALHVPASRRVAELRGHVCPRVHTPRAGPCSLSHLLPPPPAPQLHFQKHKNVPELAPFEARPSYRQQAMQREGRFHTKVVGFGDVTVSAEK